MLKKITLFVFIHFVTCAYSQAHYSFPKQTKKVLFLGNSIAYAGKFITYFETIYRLEHPKEKIEFINLGLPSETVSGLSEKNHANGKFPRPDLRERLVRSLNVIQPDFIFVNYGINDGIFMPFDEGRFKKYKKGICWLDEKIKRRKIPVIYITNSVYDKTKDSAYSNVMAMYADWLISLRYTNNWDVIDVFNPMNLVLQNKRAVTPSFKLTRDGVHPTSEGHWIMAKELLLAFGCTKIAKDIAIEKALQNYKKGNRLFSLIQKRQQLMKDAWLTNIGHKRPNMKKGTPLNIAKKQYIDIESEIVKLLE